MFYVSFVRQVASGNMLFRNAQNDEERMFIYTMKYDQKYHNQMTVKVNGPFVQTFCIEKDSYMMLK